MVVLIVVNIMHRDLKKEGHIGFPNEEDRPCIILPSHCSPRIRKEIQEATSDKLWDLQLSHPNPPHALPTVHGLGSRHRPPQHPFLHLALGPHKTLRLWAILSPN